MHVPVSVPILPDDFPEDSLPFSSETFPPWPVHGGLPPCNGPILSPSAAPHAREVSQPNNTPSCIADSGSIKIRRADRADWVPWVLRTFPVVETGTGRIKGEFCGTFQGAQGKTVGACKNKPGQHKPVMIPNSCKRRECPECWPSWAVHGKQRVAAVLNGYLNAKMRYQRQIDPSSKPEYYPSHGSFHPKRQVVMQLTQECWKELEGPEGITSNDFHKLFWKKYRKCLDEVVKSAGVTGYVDISHDIRLRKDKEAMKADAMQDVNRYRDVLDQPDFLDHVKFSPHSHLLYFGYIENAESFYERTGWTYRKHRVIANAEALVYYLLSHAPVIDGLHNIRYCGSLNKHRLMVEGTYIIPEFPDCPECLKEGGKPGESGYVVAKLGPVRYERDKDTHKNTLVEWGFDIISNKPYRKTERIQQYRILKPGEKPDRKDLPPGADTMPRDDWLKLTDLGKLRYRFKQYYSPWQWSQIPGECKPWPCKKWV